MKNIVYRATVVSENGFRYNIKVEGIASRSLAKKNALTQARQFVSADTKISVERLYLD